MIAALVLVAAAVMCLGPAGVLLDGARWTWRAPSAAIALWQALGVAGAVATVGAGLALAVGPLHTGVLPGLLELFGQVRRATRLTEPGIDEAVGLTVAAEATAALVGCLGVTALRTFRARGRHRRLLDLLSRETEAAPGAVVLDHPGAAAYCLPGLRPRIVLSAGMLGLLDGDELAAVVDHERGHAESRHGLVMLPFASVAELLRWVPYARRSPEAVSGLLEMAADDFSARRHDPRDLASALLQLVARNATPDCALGARSLGAPRRMAAPPCAFGIAPPCAFGAASSLVGRRVRRLLDPGRTSRWAAVALVSFAALVVAGPLAVLALAT